jgi:hypothetical protein
MMNFAGRLRGLPLPVPVRSQGHSLGTHWLANRRKTGKIGALEVGGHASS